MKKEDLQTSPFTKYVEVDLGVYNSPMHTSAAHNLGAAPSGMMPVVKCLIADGGYAVGDEIDFPHGAYTGGSYHACNFWSNATVVGLAIEDTRGFNCAGKIASQFQLADASWHVYVRCWV